MNEIKLKISWKVGRRERFTETVLPMEKSWKELEEYIRLAMKTALKYNTEIEIPNGLLKKGEVI